MASGQCFLTADDQEMTVCADAVTGRDVPIPTKVVNEIVASLPGQLREDLRPVVFLCKDAIMLLLPFHDGVARCRLTPPLYVPPPDAPLYNEVEIMSAPVPKGLMPSPGGSA